MNASRGDCFIALKLLSWTLLPSTVTQIWFLSSRVVSSNLSYLKSAVTDLVSLSGTRVTQFIYWFSKKEKNVALERALHPTLLAYVKPARSSTPF